MSDKIPYCALTIRQPFAWAVMGGHKHLEYRSWPTDYRGPLIIHAAKTEWRREDWVPAGDREAVPPDELECGAIVGLVTLEAVERLPDGWGARYAWILTDPVELARPIECNGALGLWRPRIVPAELADELDVLLKARGEPWLAVSTSSSCPTSRKSSRSATTGRAPRRSRSRPTAGTT